MDQTHRLARDCGLRVCFGEGDSDSSKEAENDDRRAHFELDGTGVGNGYLNGGKSQISDRAKYNNRKYGGTPQYAGLDDMQGQGNGVNQTYVAK